MEESAKKKGSAFDGLNDDVLRLILDSLYEVCRYEFEQLEDARLKHVRTVKKLLPLGYTSRSFAKLVLPYVWQYVRIITNNLDLRSHNTEILNILKKDQALFPYGDYLKELEINFTVNSGDERCHKIPTISSFLQVITNHCTNIQRLIILAKVEPRNGTSETINQAFHRYVSVAKWNNFKDLVASAFSHGALKDVTLSSNFVLMDDDCLTKIAQHNPGIRKLSIRGPQFSNRGIEAALQSLGGSLIELEISNLLGDGSNSASTSSPLKISIDTLLKNCRNLQTIHLAGINYRPTNRLEVHEYTCPLQSITANQVDEDTLKQLLSHTDKRTLSQIKITNPYDVIEWDSFLRLSVSPCMNLEKLILYMLRCRKHKYNYASLDPKSIMKNIMTTLQLTEGTVNLLCPELKQWRVLVGKDTGDNGYSVEAEGVDFVSKTCILDYDTMALSEYYIE